MKKAILGKKIGMSQIFTPDGTMIPVTVVKAGPCPVVQVKTAEKDGYSAVKVGFESMGEIKKGSSRVNKPLQGIFAKAGVQPTRYLKELKLENAGDYAVGQQIAPLEAGLQALQSDVDGIKFKLPNTVPVVYPNIQAVNTDLYRAAAYGAYAGDAAYARGCAGYGGYWG